MSVWLLNGTAVITTLLSLWILFHKNFRLSSTWHATVTPLASIIGSGFLVSAPLLLLTSGRWALAVMVVIVLLAYAIGSSIRFNIKHIEPLLKNKPTNGLVRIENFSRPILGMAYIISVAFYLKLLSAFVLRNISVVDHVYENILTTFLLLFIGVTGKLRGLSILEMLETYSVNTKLAIIFALIVTHFFYNSELLIQGKWVVNAYPHDSLWLGFRKILGLLIIIQGFETSRYIGHAYSPEMRIRTMRYAQWISGCIYVLFVALAMVVFNDVHQISETTVSELCRIVAPALPILLVIAAVMSQFSAAVADTVGSGGLLSEVTRNKVKPNDSYLLISLVAVGLTWLTNIYEIISIASKAFAIYYALQVMLTLLSLKDNESSKSNRLLFIYYGILLCVLCSVIILGIPAE